MQCYFEARQKMNTYQSNVNLAIETYNSHNHSIQMVTKIPPYHRSYLWPIFTVKIIVTLLFRITRHSELHAIYVFNRNSVGYSDVAQIKDDTVYEASRSRGGGGVVFPQQKLYVNKFTNINAVGIRVDLVSASITFSLTISIGK